MLRWLVFAWICAAVGLAQPVETLRTSKDPDDLLAAATAVIRAGDPRAIAQLGDLLGSAEFLARLKDLTHLKKVFDAMEAAPSAETGQLCLRLASNAEFTKVPVRLNYLLAALAAVRPMSEPAASLFRSLNRQGYYSVSGPLLVANGTPRALQVFEEMIADPAIRPDSREDSIFCSIVPKRTQLPVLETVARLLEWRLDARVRAALLDSVFDYQPKRWFGPERTPPVPPAWESASAGALQLVRKIAKKNERSAGLPSTTRRAIRATIESLPVK